MSQGAVPVRNQTSRALRLTVPALVAGFIPGAAHAHDFGKDNDLYARFAEGAGVVFNDIPLLLASIALGIFVTLWRREGFPVIWAFLAAGIAGGLVLPMEAFVIPELASLPAAIALGLAGAAALKISTFWLRVTALVAGVLLAVGALGGHAPGSVPFGAYIGIFFGLNLVTATSAMGTSIALGDGNAPVPRIAMRALSSWVVAIAVMMLALIYRQGAV